MVDKCMRKTSTNLSCTHTASEASQVETHTHTYQRFLCEMHLPTVDSAVKLGAYLLCGICYIQFGYIAPNRNENICLLSYLLALANIFAQKRKHKTLQERTARTKFYKWNFSLYLPRSPIPISKIFSYIRLSHLEWPVFVCVLCVRWWYALFSQCNSKLI